MKFTSILTVLLAGSAVSVISIQAKSTQAAVLTYDFSVAIDPASELLPGTQGNGSFSFDDIRPAFGSYYPVQQLSFKFDGFSSLYTEQDDVAYPAYPLVNAVSGSNFGLDFSFRNQDSLSSIAESISFRGARVLSGSGEPNQRLIGSISYHPQLTASVPEPPNLIGLLLAGGAYFLLRIKRAAIKSDRHFH